MAAKRMKTRIDVTRETKGSTSAKGVGGSHEPDSTGLGIKCHRQSQHQNASRFHLSLCALIFYPPPSLRHSLSLSPPCLNPPLSLTPLGIGRGMATPTIFTMTNPIRG